MDFPFAIFAKSLFFIKKDMHTEKFLEKHKLLLKKREEERLNRIRIKEEKKQITYLKNLEKKKERYELLKKENSEKYESYLLYLKKYRKANKKNVDHLFSDCAKVYFKGQKKHHYVNKSGEVFSSTGRKIKCSAGRNGYVQVSTGELLHRIIWKAFNGEIPEGMEIDHIIPIKDGGTNDLSNLRILTHKQNCNNPKSIENYKKHNKNVDRSYLKKNF